MDEFKELLNNEKIDERIKSLRNRKKMKRVIQIASIIIIVSAIILFIYETILFVKRATLFSLNNIIVKGNNILSAKDIFQIGELSNKDNIFNINIHKLKKRLELHPLIKRAEIKRQLPDKLLIIIKERKGIALLNLQDRKVSHLYELDEDGYVIAEDNNIIDIDKPVITGVLGEQLIPGEQIANTNIRKVLKTLYKIEEVIYHFDKTIAEINIDNYYPDVEYTLIIDKWNFPVYLGKKFDFLKLKKLNFLLMVLSDKLDRLEYVDFKYNDAVGKFKS